MRINTYFQSFHRIRHCGKKVKFPAAKEKAAMPDFYMTAHNTYLLLLCHLGDRGYKTRQILDLRRNNNLCSLTIGNLRQRLQTL